MNNSVYLNHVCLASIYKNPLGCRRGTVHISANDFYKRFGNPHQLANENILEHTKDVAYDDNKVTAIWCFDTPRGVGIVRDYWWNGDNEMSLQANNRKVTLWLAKYLKALGIQTTC
jgi:hypothetical protein